MTTPNGDYVPNRNPDHKRHYRREDLRSMLASAFKSPQVEYAIRGGTSLRLGLQSWSLRAPVPTLLSMAGNALNGFASSGAGQTAMGTYHLVAVARKGLAA
jgi:hypothetical protein